MSTRRDGHTDAARASLGWVDALFEASPVGMAVFDSEHRFLCINAAMAELNGISVAEHLGRRMGDVVPEVAAIVGPILDGVLASGESVRDIPIVGSTPSKPGVERHWRGSYLPIECDGMSAVAVFVEERTAQVSVERALRASESRFRTICEAAPLGIVLSDTQGRVVYANPALRELSGLATEDLLNAGARRLLHPEDERRVLTTYLHAVQERESFHVDARFQRDGGEVLWTETVGRALHDGDTFLGMLAMTSDVTENRRILAALHESEVMFRELAENVDAVFYLAQPAGGVDYVSSGFDRIWGRSAEELRTNPKLWLEVVHADDRERVRALFKADRTHFRAEYRIWRPDGSMRWVSDRSFPVRDSAGNIVRIAGVATDETARRALEEQLLQAQRLESIGRLAGGVAHDFNNLLTLIMSHAAFAREESHGNDEDLAAIQHAARRAEDLTRQLLSFARRQVIEPKVLDVNQLTTNVERMLRRLIGEDVELETHLAPAVWRVRADPSQLEQVLVNLAVNGRDALPNGGRLTIETSNVVLDEGYRERHAAVAPGKYVLLAVSDNGTGIDPAVLPMIFEPFFTTKESGSGTGLGLATCYGIVKQAGGHIWAYSEPGKGATFKIYLPRATGELEDVVHVASPARVHGSETVLVVEDDDMVRAIALRTLRGKGFQVLEAANGDDALQVASAYDGHIHLLLTDVVMPRMGGRELAARLAEDRSEMRVLFASGYTQNAIVNQGVLEGGLHFLQKPYVPATLASRVREVLDAAEV